MMQSIVSCAPALTVPPPLQETYMSSRGSDWPSTVSDVSA